MADIVALFQCTAPYLTTTSVRRLSRVIVAILAMSGRVTMLGISCWSGQGGSYRTAQRLFQTAIPWAMLFWLFFRQHLLNPGERYLLAGDETVVTQSGRKSFGLERFFSSLYGKAVPGLSFMALSLVGVQQRRSYPTMVEQIVRRPAAKAAGQARQKPAGKANRAARKGKPGRPKGSKNGDKTKVVLTTERQLLQSMMSKQLLLVNGLIELSHIALDGKFGNRNALQVVRGCGLHLISKLRHDAALYFAYDGVYAGRGPRRKYGDKVTYDRIPAQYLQQTTVEANIQTDTYPAHMWHKEFAEPLNVVIILKTNCQTRAQAHVVLFSSDLELAYDHLMDYYGLRFQLEFNFRDAKQYWGLEDFMNVEERAITNAANLSLFMVDVAHALIRPLRQDNPHFGVLDLKALFRGRHYVAETLKLLPEKPEPILLARIFDHLSSLGSVHRPQPRLSSP